MSVGRWWDPAARPGTAATPPRTTPPARDPSRYARLKETALPGHIHHKPGIDPHVQVAGFPSSPWLPPTCVRFTGKTCTGIGLPSRITAH